MRRLHPPTDLTEVLADDARNDIPSGAAGDAELSDEDLLHEYAYPSGHPWLRANMVAALDGATTVKGVSDGLSGPVDKRVFGLLRALADVVVAGAGTVRAEGYRGVRVAERMQSMRASLGQHPHPPVAIVSASLRLDPGSAVFTETATRPIVLTCDSAPTDRRDRLARVADVVAAGDLDVDPHLARAALHERGLTRILCEGGPTLLRHLIGAGVVDELCLTVSPVLVGGDERRTLQGPVLDPPTRLRLRGILEQDGILLTRYLVEH